MNNKKIVKMTMWAIMIIIALFLIYIIRIPLSKGLKPILYAVLTAYVLSPLICRLEKNNVPRIVSISIVYLLIILFFCFAVYYLFPQTIKGIRSLSLVLPIYSNAVKMNLEHFYSHCLPNGLPPGMQSIIDKNLLNLQNLINDTLANSGNFIANMLSGLLDFALGFVLAFYLLLDIEIIKNRFLNIIPIKRRSEITEYIVDIDVVLSAFIRGQLLVSLILSIIIFVGLSMLNIKYALLLGFIGGMMDIIPYFGPILGAIPALITALIQEPMKALWVLILFIFAQQIEGMYLSPKIVGEKIGLHPIFAITAVIVGGEMFGILGMLFAVPVLAIIKVVFCKIKRTYFSVNE